MNDNETTYGFLTKASALATRHPDSRWLFEFLLVAAIVEALILIARAVNRR